MKNTNYPIIVWQPTQINDFLRRGAAFRDK